MKRRRLKSSGDAIEGLRKSSFEELSAIDATRNNIYVDDNFENIQNHPSYRPPLQEMTNRLLASSSPVFKPIAQRRSEATLPKTEDELLSEAILLLSKDTLARPPTPALKTSTAAKGFTFAP